MLGWLILLFVGVPLLELALLLAVGDRMGLLPTLGLVIVTGILGAALARQQGLATLAGLRTALEQGRLPHQEIVEGILILVAAAVLLTPGLLTDAVGFLLLVPVVRGHVRVKLLEWGARRFRPLSAYESSGERQVVDVEVTFENRNKGGQ